MVTSSMTKPLSLSIASPGYKLSSFPLFPQRNLTLRPVISALSSSYGDSSLIGFSSRRSRLPSKHDHQGDFYSNPSNGVIEAKKGNPPIMPAVMTPGGPLDLSTMYLNCPGGSTYSVLAIYDCMSWIKPKVGTVCFGVAASQGALLLAGGEKGMRYAMPNARIMIHQPQSGCGGHVEDVRRQVNEAVQSRHKIDKMYAAFTGQPLEKVQQYTERDRFLSVSEAMEFGLIDGVLETEY
ncbi:UNVERIFIED_CONTAM: ATP-dependent Clp protease proteolytic subunit, chloroplastic [Sesamum radiatum]|uniref:ATP-dependent Clp protease proteolytic subunit n=1 Tax=Sesamum radiatum TaxID=300843 RepID=A0AAW2RW87_SESRA